MPSPAEWSSSKVFSDWKANSATPAQIAALADSPEAAGEIYLVSAMFVDKDIEQERRYLEALAQAMGLSSQITVQLESQLDTMATA